MDFIVYLLQTYYNKIHTILYLESVGISYEY